MRRWLFLGAAVLTEVTGSLSLKGALDLPALYALTTVGYLASFVFLTGTLRNGMPLGQAYGIWGAAGVALTAIFSLLIFDESLTGVMIIGIVLIMAGVLCVELGSQASPRRHESEEVA